MCLMLRMTRRFCFSSTESKRVPEHLPLSSYLALVPAGNKLTALMSSCRSSSFQPFPPPPPPPPPLACSPPRAACLAWISASFSFCSWAFTSCTCSHRRGQKGAGVSGCSFGDVYCSCISSPPHLLLHGRLADVFGARGQEFVERLQAGDKHISCDQWLTSREIDGSNSKLGWISKGLSTYYTFIKRGVFQSFEEPQRSNGLDKEDF